MEQGKMKESQEAMKESLKVASEITNDYGKSIAYSEISKVLMEQGKMKESQEAMKESLKVASEITNDRYKSRAYSEISKVLMEQGKMKEAIQIAENIKQGSIRTEAFNDFGKIISYEEAQNCLPLISSENNQSAIIKGMSEKINEQLEISVAIYPYFYHYSKYNQNLSNILSHQAKRACFFEEERNEEKLDILSEVLEIKDWRKISA
jgi:ATP/maltotriose-dependent transcriptional regulator MalT